MGRSHGTWDICAQAAWTATGGAASLWRSLCCTTPEEHTHTELVEAKLEKKQSSTVLLGCRRACGEMAAPHSISDTLGEDVRTHRAATAHRFTSCQRLPPWSALAALTVRLLRASPRTARLWGAAAAGSSTHHARWCQGTPRRHPCCCGRRCRCCCRSGWGPNCRIACWAGWAREPQAPAAPLPRGEAPDSGRPSAKHLPCSLLLGCPARSGASGCAGGCPALTQRCAGWHTHPAAAAAGRPSGWCAARTCPLLCSASLGLVAKAWPA